MNCMYCSKLTFKNPHDNCIFLLITFLKAFHISNNKFVHPRLYASP